MKTMTKMSLSAVAMMIGVAGFAATGNADDQRVYDRREPVKVVVVQQPERHDNRVVYRQPVRGSLFDRLDINNDGRVSKWEFSQRYGNGRMAMRTFNRIDVNDSGSLGKREVANGRGWLNELHMRG